MDLNDPFLGAMLLYGGITLYLYLEVRKVRKK